MNQTCLAWICYILGEGLYIRAMNNVGKIDIGLENWSYFCEQKKRRQITKKQRQKN